MNLAVIAASSATGTSEVPALITKTVPLPTISAGDLIRVSAIAFLVRAALMNMSSPVYNAFVMEEVEPEARATVASLASMSWNFGWAFSPTLSGWIQVNYGFSPLFVGTITTYVSAIWMYWRFFLRKEKHKAVSSEE